MCAQRLQDQPAPAHPHAASAHTKHIIRTSQAKTQRCTCRTAAASSLNSTTRLFPSHSLPAGDPIDPNEKIVALATRQTPNKPDGVSTRTKLDSHPQIDADKNIGTPADGQKHGMPYHSQINTLDTLDTLRHSRHSGTRHNRHFDTPYAYRLSIPRPLTLGRHS